MECLAFDVNNTTTFLAGECYCSFLSFRELAFVVAKRLIRYCTEVCGTQRQSQNYWEDIFLVMMIITLVTVCETMFNISAQSLVLLQSSNRVL